MTFAGKGFWEVIGQQPQEAANNLVARVLDAGINFFDTANVYSEGESEKMLGKALGKRRQEVVVATKVRSRMGPGTNEVGLSRGHIMQAVEASLTRLGTDYIDLYQIHGFDPITPLEETMRALDDLMHSGKVRYIGCSNLAAWQLMKSARCRQSTQVGCSAFRPKIAIQSRRRKNRQASVEGGIFRFGCCGTAWGRAK